MDLKLEIRKSKSFNTHMPTIDPDKEYDGSL